MFPYQDLEPGSWEASYDAQAPTCSICGKRLKGRRCYCEAPPVERERQLGELRLVHVRQCEESLAVEQVRGFFCAASRAA